MSVTFSAAQVVNGHHVWLTTEENELNISNSNFFGLMDLLGYANVDYCGRFEGDALVTLRQVVTVAVRTLAINPVADAGTETTVETGGGGMTMIHCGRREGYYADRLTALLAIIDVALFNNGFVTWG